MFDRIAKGKARKNRWKAPILMTGALIHGALFTGMWVKGLWEIRKVDAAEADAALTLGPAIPTQEAPKGAPKPAEPEKKKPPKKVADEPTQPLEKKPEEKPVPDTGGGEVTPDQPPGNGDDDGPIGTGTEIGDPLPPLPVVGQPKPLPVPDPPKPLIVQSKEVEQRRISGERLILPDSETAQQIARADGKAEGKVQLCLDSAGRVSSVVMRKSTEFAAYDQKLLREMRSWRYQPYQVNGVAAPVCTMVTFIYRQR